MTVNKIRRDIETRSIAEQAVEWLVALQEDSSAVRAAFSTWVRESPKNLEAFLRASALDTTLGEMGAGGRLGELPNPLPDLRGLALGLPRGESTEGARREGARHREFRVKAWSLAASVAVVAVAAGALAWTLGGPDHEWQRYVSAVGEQRTIELADGSTMFLSPNAELELLFDTQERRLRLKSGAAMFKVAHDATRPFRVRSGEVVVQAIGTQFTVNRHSRGDMVVAVVEGTVQVSRDRGLVERVVAPIAGFETAQSFRLAAGEETRVATDGRVASPRPSVVDRTEPWRERRLTFVNEDLRTIADELNRFNHTRIRIEGETAARLRYAISISADDPQSLLDVLGQDSQLVIEHRSGEIVIRARE